jgi:hypothetical protein
MEADKNKENLVDKKGIDALERISSSSYMIVLGNPLLNAKFDLTAFQMKIFHFLVLNTKQTAEGFSVTKVKVSEVSNFLKTKTSDYLYNLLEKESRKLMKKEIYLEDENSWKVANILAQIEYHKKEGAFSFMFPPMLSNYLLQLKKNFTYIDVRNIVSMDSIYAIRFYGFCKEFERFGKFQFSVDEIRKMFNLENKYEMYGLFKQKVIVKAQEELVKNSDLIFIFKEIKEGKKVVALQFQIEKNISKTKNQLEIDNRSLETLLEDAPFEIVESIPNANAIEIIIKQLFEKLTPWSISISTINEWVEKYPVIQVELGVDYVLAEVKKDKNKIKNVPAYLSKIISSSQLMDKHLQIEEEKNVVKAMLKKNNEEKLNIEQQKQIQNEFLERLYQEKKALAESILNQNLILYKRVLDVLGGSLYSSIYYDNYLTKVGTAISKETFLAYFRENTGFEAIVITTLETFKDIDIFKEHQKKYKAEATKLGLSYY